MGGWPTPRPGRFTPQERDPIPSVQEAGWAPGPFWTGMGNLFSTGVQPLAGRCAGPHTTRRIIIIIIITHCLYVGHLQLAGTYNVCGVYSVAATL